MKNKNYIQPDLKMRDFIERHSHSEINLCLTCCSCSVECPVNSATDRLDPRKIVRMAGLGVLDELLVMPEIWYCLTCKRCNHMCPMTVKPNDLINYCRKEVFYRKKVSYDTVIAYRKLFSQLQLFPLHHRFPRLAPQQ